MDKSFQALLLQGEYPMAPCNQDLPIYTNTYSNPYNNMKMDTATMLEEAHKYVRFLQAQVSALQSMPFLDPTAQNNTNGHFYYGGLDRLNRQQLLEVLRNSNVAQNLLYMRGCCVYSVEQLVVLERIVADRENILRN